MYLARSYYDVYVYIYIWYPPPLGPHFCYSFACLRCPGYTGGFRGLGFRGLPGQIETAKTLYCPNLFGSEEQKSCTVPKNSKKSQSFEGLQLKDWDSTVFLLLCPKKIGTVQHFRPSENAVLSQFFGSRHAKTPYCPNFLGSEEQKRCIVPKLQKNQSFEGLQLKDWDSTVLLLCPKQIGTVQHFRPSGGPQYLNYVDYLNSCGLSNNYIIQIMKIV